MKKLKISHVNEKFGKLLIIEYSHHVGKSVYWKCLCDCGNYKTIRYSCLNKNSSCGICDKIYGKNHYAWAGFGEIPKNVYTTYKHSAKAKNLEFNVSIEYLWNLFIKQNGKCALTGWDICFNKTYKSKKEKTASPDRIDSNKGYIEGNMQWVHKDVNKLKKNMSDDKFIEICKAVYEKSLTTHD